MEERIYSAESDIRHPLQLVRDMAADVWSGRYLAWRIFLRDLNARYRQTALGWLWIFIPPIVVAVGLTAANRAEVIRVAATDIPYPVYVLFSMTLWQTFSESLNAPLQAIYEFRAVLARINFQREALMLARLGDVLVSVCVRLVLVTVAFLWFGVSAPPSAVLALPALFALIFCGFAIGLLLAPLATLYLDLAKSSTIVLGFWLFISPVLYPVPQGAGTLATIVRWNPVTPLLVTVRELATGSPLTMLGGFLVVAALSVAAIFVAWITYRLALPYVIERLSA